MKKFLIIFGLLFIGLSASAEVVEIESNINMVNFWDKNGKEVQKITEVGSKIINANKLDKRIPIMLERDLKNVNAFSIMNPKLVVVSSGLLPYIDNDDELAFIMGHEMAHALDAYQGVPRWIAMKFNSKAYEYKADLIGIDLMEKAGYNPIAAITEMNKWMPESMFDGGIFTTHPKTSKRLFEMYKYIYKKYPSAMNSDMVHNINYQNYTYSAQKEIDEFKQEEKQRENARKNKYSL